MANHALITDASPSHVANVREYRDIQLELLSLRKRIDATLEHMLEVLNVIDGDENLEETDHGGTGTGNGCDEDDEPTEDSEPSLGSFEHVNQHGTWRTANGGDDTELDDCDREDGGDDEATGDDEPSLAAFTSNVDQSGWSGGCGNDLEAGETAPVSDRPRPRLQYRPEGMAKTEVRRLVALVSSRD